MSRPPSLSTSNNPQQQKSVSNTSSSKHQSSHQQPPPSVSSQMSSLSSPFNTASYLQGANFSQNSQQLTAAALLDPNFFASSVGTNGGVNRNKPSLLSGYHNPFSSPERSDLIMSGPAAGLNLHPNMLHAPSPHQHHNASIALGNQSQQQQQQQQQRYYVQPNNSSSSSSAQATNAALAASAYMNSQRLDEKLNNNNSSNRHNQMNIITNQQQQVNIFYKYYNFLNVQLRLKFE